MPRPAADPPPPRDLREACVLAARDLIASRGLEALSLREVARELGVSHQAPYRHYPSRDHLLAEVMRRCFQHFAGHLDARTAGPDPREDLRALGRQYLDFARRHPLEYRLMFGTPWPASADHPDLIRDARHAFEILREVVGRLHAASGLSPADADLDALAIWSSMHGLATILQSDSVTHLGLPARRLALAPEHVSRLLDGGLDALLASRPAAGTPAAALRPPADGATRRTPRKPRA